MTFQFHDFADFLTMPGKSMAHGPFVWTVYAVVLIALVGLVYANRVRKRDIIKKIQLVQLQQEQLKQNKQQDQ
jgi:heme exporter protein CcmD